MRNPLAFTAAGAEDMAAGPASMSAERSLLPAQFQVASMMTADTRAPPNHRGRGLGAAVAARALRWITGLSPSTTTLLAPFCGLGEALIAAQAAGLGAVGVERNRKRAARAAARVAEARPARGDTGPAPPR